MSPRSWTIGQIAAAGGPALYAVSFALLLVLRPGGFDSPTFVLCCNLFQALAMVFAGACALAQGASVAGRDKRWAAAWILVGLGNLCWAAGQFTFSFYEWRGVEAPLPSWFDVGFTAMYPLALAGVVLLFGNLRAEGRAKLLLDGAITVSSVAILSWYFVVREAWAQSGLSALGKYVAVGYPIGDVILIFGAVVLLSGASSSSSSAEKERRVPLLLLAAGFSLFALADTLYTFDSLRGTYHTGSWYDTGWLYGALASGLAALAPLAWPGLRANTAPATFVPLPNEPVPPAPPLPPREQFAHVSRLARVLLPYLAASGAFVLVAGYDRHRNGAIESSVFVAGLVLLLLVILRQVFTLVENQNLAARLRASGENLEALVARRTEQLEALQALTAAVNDTLDEDEVIASALLHTRRALGAEALALWLGDENVACCPLARIVGLDDQTDPLVLRDQLADLPAPPSGDVGVLSVGLCADASTLLLRAPLCFQHRTLGHLGVIRQSAPWERSHERLLVSIGLAVGAALENARRFRAASEAADRDPVTGLLNHRAIHERLRTALASARAAGTPLSVLMMDVSNFKLFNDTYGHPAGDAVLKSVAGVLRAACPPGAHVGRYGGDEFLAVLSATGGEAADVIARRLHEAVAVRGFHSEGGPAARTIPIALSAGIAVFPDDGDSRHELLTLADANLYAAKESGEKIMGTTQARRDHNALRAGNGSFAVLDAMVAAVDNKDHYTRRHSEEVTEYALWIGEEIGLSDETLRVLRAGGLLHDVGKIGVPDDILRKPGRLTNEEVAAMQSHPLTGALIVAAMPGMEALVSAVRSHHEHWDGRGYPDALAGEEIPFLGRVLAVADAFSAMTTDRPYRKGLSRDHALEQIGAGAGTQFDPTLACAFLSAAAKRRPAPAAALPLAA